jgi:hypothetical protein
LRQLRKSWLDSSSWRGSGGSRQKNGEDQRRAVSAESEKGRAVDGKQPEQVLSPDPPAARATERLFLVQLLPGRGCIFSSYVNAMYESTRAEEQNACALDIAPQDELDITAQNS